MTKRGMPEVMCKTGCFDEITEICRIFDSILPPSRNALCDPAPNLRALNRVS
jgi:hypothetical protein